MTPERARANIPTELAWLACLAVLAWSVSNWTELIRLARETYTAAPLWDYWRIVANIPRYQNFDLSVFWEQHNEHRIIFPEIAMAADMMLFKGHAILPLALAYGFQFLTLAVYSWMLWSYLDPRLRWFTVLLGLGIAGWPGVALFLGHPFLVQWLFLQGGVVVALTALPRSMTIAIGAGVIANYSAANGILVWPVLVVAAIALRLPRRQIEILAIAGLIFGGLYFAGYHPSPNLHLSLLFQKPIFAMKWAAAYLSLPFGFAGAQTGLAFGFGGMLLLAALLFLSFRRVQPATALFLGASLFVVASAIVAAAGRMSPDHAIPSTELDVRFVSVPIWFWISILFGMALAIRDWKWNWGILAPIALLLGWQMQAASPWINRHLPEFQKDRLAALALENGVLDGPTLSDTLYYDPEFVKRAEGQLRARKLSVFASSRFERIGKKAATIFAEVQPDGDASEPISASIVEGGMKMSGPSAERTDDLVFVNEKGTIVGLGGRLGSGWSGFANLEIPSKTLRAYRVYENKISLFGAPVSVPEAIPIAYWSMGQFLNGIEWENGHGIEKGGGPGVSVSKPFQAPPGNCLVVLADYAPMEGETVELLDAENQKHIATIPLSATDSARRLWRVEVPSIAKNLKISLGDHVATATQRVGAIKPARCTSSYK